MVVHAHSEPLSDEELLRHIGSGCTDCFSLLFYRYCRQVFSVSFRILRDRAETEDILQEVFLAIYLQQERFDPAKGSVRTWVLQFAYFKALLRRRYLKIRNFYKQEEISEAREPRQGSASKLLGMSAGEWTHYVETGIAALNAKQRQVIELVHFEGYTLQEVSSKQATTRRTHHARFSLGPYFLLVVGIGESVADETDIESDRVTLRKPESILRLINLLEQHVRQLSTARESLAAFLRQRFMHRMSEAVGVSYLRLFAGTDRMARRRTSEDSARRTTGKYFRGSADRHGFQDGYILFLGIGRSRCTQTLEPPKEEMKTCAPLDPRRWLQVPGRRSPIRRADLAWIPESAGTFHQRQWKYRASIRDPRWDQRTGSYHEVLPIALWLGVPSRRHRRRARKIDAPLSCAGPL
jgi:RNA polymerase sigma-70 factor, ECF subfamily